MRNLSFYFYIFAHEDLIKGITFNSSREFLHFVTCNLLCLFYCSKVAVKSKLQSNAHSKTQWICYREIKLHS